MSEKVPTMREVAVWTHCLAFIAGVYFAEWSARENHATMTEAGRWLRSWFV